MLHSRSRKAAALEFLVGDQVTCNAADRGPSLEGAAEVGKLRPRWEGPITVAALGLTRTPLFRAASSATSTGLIHCIGQPGPVSDPGQEAHSGAASQLQAPPWLDLLPGALAGTRLGGRLVGAGGAWHLAHCPERVAEYEAAYPRRPKALWARHRAGERRRRLGQLRRPPARRWAHPAHHAAAVGLDSGGAGGAGSAILNKWPEEGWQLGRVRRRSPQVPFRVAQWHAVGNRLATAATSLVRSTRSWRRPRTALAGSRSAPCHWQRAVRWSRFPERHTRQGTMMKTRNLARLLWAAGLAQAR
jgi:hypothetical protein